MDSLFFERYAKLCAEIDETPNSVAKAVGASSGSVTAWKNGSEPRYKTLVKIADYFGVSTEYLTGKTNYRMIELFRGTSGYHTEKIEPTDDGKLYSGREALRFALWGGDVDNLDDDDLDDVLRYAEFIRERKKKQKG